MGKVLTRLKIFPKEGQDAQQLADRIKQTEGCNTSKVEDFVFGTKIVIASFICQDGESKDFEDIVKLVEGVSEVQVEEVGLIS
ncbi:hypothetical protein KJ765_06185 [Candidatus Micrarchaeota archaeon]|nr:hypothetical protein [Candidatus Micrarchaeota archaeon]